MAVTLNEIKQWLDNKELNYGESEQHDSSIHLGFGSESFQGYIKIELEDDGELIQFYINQILNEEHLKVKNHQHQLLVQQYLLLRNYETKFGTWEIDSTDGEVRFAIEVPLVDAKMTENQFSRIFSVLVSAEEEFNTIDKILETGEIPDDEDDEFASMMAEFLAAKLMKDLEEFDGDAGALLESLQSDSKKSKKDEEEGI